MIDQKPRKRHKASSAEWVQLREVLADESCWVCGGVWKDLHHILPRSHSGDDVVENLAPVCRECHMRLEDRDAWARAQVRGALMPSHLWYLAGRVRSVEAFLDRNYPIQPAAEDAGKPSKEKDG